MRLYRELSSFIRSKVDEFLEFAVPIDAPIENILVDSVETRRLIRAAGGLLYRNHNSDTEKAIKIIRWVLSRQFKNRFHLITGNWKVSPDSDRLDSNWREFIGCELIIIYENYHDRFSKNLNELIKLGLMLAAENSKIRNVSPYYTNIATMSAFLMEYVGRTFKTYSLARLGLQKAYQIFKLYFKNQTFSEFNSPTYTGVTCIGLNLWRKYGSLKLQKLGEILEAELWLQTAKFYNANLKNLAGPYIRGYGMNMLCYSSIIGLWMLYILDDQNFAPYPTKKDNKYFEISNIVPIVHLDPHVPNSAIKEFTQFSNERFLEGKIQKGNEFFTSRMDFHVMISSKWMMGGLRRDLRNWNQRKIGTIHWKDENSNSIGWILIPGNGKTDVVVTKTHMTVFSKRFLSTIHIFVQGKDLKEHMFTKGRWILPGISFDVFSHKSSISIIPVTDLENFRERWAIGDIVDSIMEISLKFPRRLRKQQVITLEPLTE